VEADLPQLFGLAKGTFAALPGWSDERVLDLEHVERVGEREQLATLLLAGDKLLPELLPT